MKLTTMTQVTLDGVMQGNGGASDEDRRNGFDRGGWAMGAADDDTFTHIVETYQKAGAFLFGRKTYELFEPYWGAMPPGGHPIADALNQKPKYLVSTTVTAPGWDGTTLLSGDLEAEIRRLKDTPGGDLQVHGGGTLVRWLLARGLVDEMTLLVIPVVLGQGARLFPQDGPDIAMELLSTHADSRGVMTQAYRPSGRPVYGRPRGS